MKDAQLLQPTAVAVASMLAACERIDHSARRFASHEERLQLVEQTRLLRRRVESLCVTLLAEADAAGSATVVKGTPTASWLGLDDQSNVREAASEVLTARDLAASAAVRDAALTGDITVSHAKAIQKAKSQLPQDLSPDEKHRAEQLLLQKAACSDARTVAGSAPQILSELRQGSEQDEAARLAERDRRARQRRSLRFYTDGDGALLFEGSLPLVEGSTFRKLINAYAESERQRGTQDRLDPSVAMTTADQRRADALVRMLGDVQGAKLAPDVVGDRPQVVVIMHEAELRARAEAAGVLESGEQISASELRRLCCNAGIVPAILGTQSEVLDLGRATRFASRAQRRALAFRDGQCVFPKCEVPPEQCEAHHVDPWANGGRTDLKDLVLVCPHHHQLLEPDQSKPPEAQWQVRVRRGVVEVIPPSRMGKERIPIRHINPMLGPPKEPEELLLAV